MTIEFNNNIPMFLQAATVVSGVVPLSINAGIRPTGTLPLSIQGPQESCSWQQQTYETWENITYINWEEWCGKQSSGIITHRCSGTKGYNTATSGNHFTVFEGDGNTHWSNIGNAFDGNLNTYASSYLDTLPSGGGILSKGLYLRNFNLNVPVNATIQGVEFAVTGKGTASGNIIDIKARIGSDGFAIAPRENKAYGTSFSVGGETRVYGGSTDLWGTESAITPSIVNSSGFGFIYQTRLTTGQDRLDISRVQAKVYYSYRCGLPISITGATNIPISGNIPLYINPTATGYINNEMPLYTRGGFEPSSGIIPLFVKTDNTPSGTLYLFQKGTDGFTPSGVISNTATLVAEGAYRITASGQIPLFLKVDTSGDITGNIPLYTFGHNLVSNTLTLFVQDTAMSGSLNLMINGYWTVFSRPGSQSEVGSAGVLSSANVGVSTHSAAVTASKTYKNAPPDPFYLGPGDPPPLLPANIFSFAFDPRNQEVVNTDTSLDGAAPITGFLPLSITNFGGSGVMSGFIHGHDVSSGIMDLYTRGAPVVSGEMTLAIPNISGFNSLTMKLRTRGVPGV